MWHTSSTYQNYKTQIKWQTTKSMEKLLAAHCNYNVHKLMFPILIFDLWNKNCFQLHFAIAKQNLHKNAKSVNFKH
jgi:hypothetical protein